MKTYFLGIEEVRQFLRDFLVRLKAMASPPTVWCSVTPSGKALVQAIVDMISAEKLPTPDAALLHVDVRKDEAGDRVFEFSEDPATIVQGQGVLLLDGAIHSGGTMSACVDEMLNQGAADVTTYGLVLRCGSAFVPTFWGIMTDETDRSYFLLPAIPNNRLDAGGRASRKAPQVPVQIRRLDQRHVSLPPLACGVASMDRITWSDRLFQMETTAHATRTFVLERRNSILGFLTIHDIEPDGLSIDEIATDPKASGQGHGGTLLRFADTLARQKNCRFVRLNAISNRVDWYRDHGYEVTPGSKLIRLDTEEYQPMDRRILYHLDPNADRRR